MAALRENLGGVEKKPLPCLLQKEPARKRGERGGWGSPHATYAE